MIIFAAEVTAFVFGFIYRGRVSHSQMMYFWIICMTCRNMNHFVNCFLWCLQIKGDLEKSMNGVFQIYDGVNNEAHAVDYLQSQVRLKGSFMSAIIFGYTGNDRRNRCMKDSHSLYSPLVLLYFYISSWSAVGWITSLTGLQYHGIANITTLCHIPAAKQMLHNALANSPK